MARTIAAMDNPTSADPIFDRTARTWEVELLISSVAVFAMLQLPGWLDDRMFALAPRIGDSWQMILLLAYLYSKSAAIVLAITFAAHLLLRAQWIALVGMHSVYPNGVRLDRLRMGPIQRAIEEARPSSTEDAIERADNRASTVFAIGVSVALIFAFVCVFFCGSLLLVTFLTEAIGWRINPVVMMMVIFAVVMLPFIVAGFIDHGYASRLTPGGVAHRMLEATLRFYTRIGMGRRNNHILALLSSNGGERRIMAMVVAIIVAATIGVATAYVVMRTSTVLGSYALFPDDDAKLIRASHYDDQRNPKRDEAVPFVQSSVIAGPYLKVIVPYRPNRDEPAMRARCAHAATLKGDALAMARLACLGQLHALTLDGKPMTGLAYEIASDPRTGRPALLAMIDIRKLPNGRHELRVARPPRADRAADEDTRDPGFHRIPFWK